jgi:hypothetical protein
MCIVLLHKPIGKSDFTYIHGPFELRFDPLSIQLLIANGVVQLGTVVFLQLHNLQPWRAYRSRAIFGCSSYLSMLSVKEHPRSITIKLPIEQVLLALSQGGVARKKNWDEPTHIPVLI